MKNSLVLIACLLIIDSQFAIAKIHNSMSTENNLDLNNKVTTINPKSKNSKITIYYGLNDSHSRSWAQVNKNGVIGISYFQRFENSYDRGTLIYKTIQLDGLENWEAVTTGTRLEKSVLLFDALAQPHIFLATSNDYDQIITHYFKDNNNQWQDETIIHFYNEGGKFIYELSAATGPDYSYHLLILKTRSNIDSDDFMDAWINSHLYHLTNVTGKWEKELIQNYDMAYTYDMYIKSSCRQDIKVGDDGQVHVIFSKQINGNNHPDPSRLFYASNKTGNWEIELAFSNDYGSHDDAGWFPSLCLDTSGTPYISCMYVNRVSTGSAVYCKLFLLKRLGKNNWHTEIIADRDDGYYGGDGRKYTGGLSHLVFDKDNAPHIIFSDIASTHWPGTQRLNVGNIRYGVFEDGKWEFQTIYRQPLPTGFFNAIEMFGMCLLLSENSDNFRIVGQELELKSESEYTCRFVNFLDSSINENDQPSIDQFSLYQNYPNPFNLSTNIKFELSNPSPVSLHIYNIQGNLIRTLLNGDICCAGAHFISWNGVADNGRKVSTGEYFCRLEIGGINKKMKMLLLK